MGAADDGGTAQHGAGAAENDQELRLALAMRGGASLAVWIGGAVAEVERLRCSAGERPGDHPWAGLARLAGYDRVSVDVLAGASAGGLNATLLAASIVYGMRFEDMRELWVRLADLEAMSRPVPRFWQPRPESLLAGDEYFRAELARLIVEQSPQGGDLGGRDAGDRGRGSPDRDPADSADRHSADRDSADRPLGDRLDLLLTATLLDPVVEQHFDGRSGALPEERRRAFFRFRHRGRPGRPLSDFGAGADFPATALRMAQAARATSSYPFAFEPAQVHSGTAAPPEGEPDMLGLFSETAAGSGAFRVIDGGVLDNIPVSAAIRAMSEVPAERPSARWLLYLNPEPEAGGDPAGRLALPVAATALRARMSQESLLADLDALDEHNASVARTALRRRALFAPITEADPPARRQVLLAGADTAEPQNAVVRAELDAQAVLRLLTEPAGREDGRLLPPVVGDPLAGWSPQARTALGDRLSEALGERARLAPREVFDDARGLLSAVQLCLDWARDVERWAPAERLPDIGACKAELYRLRAFGQVVEGHADRYWTAGARLEPIVEVGELAGWAQRVSERRERLQHRLPSPTRPLLGAVLAELADGARFQTALGEFAAELLSIVDSSGADAVPRDPDGVDAVAEGRARLHEIADRIAALAPPRVHFEQPEQVAYGVLETSDRRPRALRALVVLTAPLDVGRAPGDRIDFLRVVSDAPSPLPFRALTGPDGRLSVQDKVRGGDLGNFGAFLSARWRANDWMWGRLDAATALAGLLVDPERLVRYNAGLGAEGLAERFRAIVTTPSSDELAEAADSAQWRAFLAELWSRRAAEVRAELAALFAAPDDEHELPATKELITERLHWPIAADELPFTAAVPAGAAPEEPQTPPIPDPERLGEQVRGYRVGRERVEALGEPRLASVALRSALIAYRAVRPGPGGVLRLLGRWALTLVKPVLLAVVLAIAAPLRSALVGYLGAAAAGLAAPVSGSFPVRCPPGECSMVWQDTGLAGLIGVNPFPTAAFTVAAASALWLGHRLMRHASGFARWGPAVLIAAVLTAVPVGIATAGVQFAPSGVVVLAALLTGLAAVGYRPLGRVLAAVLSAVVFGAVSWWVRPGLDPSWLLPAAVLTAYAQVVLLSTVDLLRPRPRPERSGRAADRRAPAADSAKEPVER